MPSVRDPPLPIHAMRTRLVACDPHGVIHLVWGVGVYAIGDKKRWVAPCYAVEVGAGTWERTSYEIKDSTLLTGEHITCLGCIAVDNGL